MELKFTPRAAHDLKRLRTFIAKHNPTAAKRISKNLKESILLLLDNPELGVESDELPGVRDYFPRSYFVRYIVKNDVVIILRVWHGKELQDG
ncbi:MAG: plasmid stabilization system protein [Thiotrichaceae bacterium]|nr:MAG: plasmid stabilization system protein [Thiotrichaceae bacterium]